MLNRDQPILETTATVRQEEDLSNELTRRDLVIRVLKGVEGSRENVVHIEVTDENARDPHEGPISLFSIVISEKDYPVLKREEKLLVDFADFPDKFVDLVRSCINPDEGEIPKHMELLKDHQARGSSSRRLEIVETNGFKRVTHLSLKMSCADDPTMVSYLSSRLYQESQRANQLEQCFHQEQNHVQQKMQSIEELQSKLQDMHEKYSALEADMKHERQRLTEENKRNEESYREKNTELKSQIESYQEELHEKKREIDKLREEINDHQLTEQDLEGKIERKEDEIKSLQETNGNLESRLSAKAEVEEENRNLQNELHSRDSKIQQVEHLLDREKSHKEQLQNDIKKYEKYTQKLKDRIQESQRSIEEGNGVIKKYQEKCRSFQAKLKELASARDTAKSQLRDKAESIRKLEDTISNLKDEIASEQRATNSVKKEKEELQAQLDESKQIIAQNKQMISCLEQELQEAPSQQPSYHRQLEATRFSRVDPRNQSSHSRTTTNRSGKDYSIESYAKEGDAQEASQTSYQRQLETTRFSRSDPKNQSSHSQTTTYHSGKDYTAGGYLKESYSSNPYLGDDPELFVEAA